MSHAHAGRPRSMQGEPHYDDVVAEVKDFLRQRLNAAREQVYRTNG